MEILLAGRFGKINMSLEGHPNWPVMSEPTSAGKFSSKSGCRKEVQLAG